MNKLERLEYITSELEDEGYEGIDQDLTISLGEYNIIVKSVSDSGFKAIYQVHYDQTYYCKVTFTARRIGDLIDNYANSGFLNWIGTDLETWSRSSVVMILFDLMQYHGHLNIFGDPYNAVTLTELYGQVVS